MKHRPGEGYNMTTTANIPYQDLAIGGSCLWGQIQFIRLYADGIALVATPSHGGFILSPARMKDMSADLRKCSFSNDNHFEEDCSYVAVVLAFPHLFSAETVEESKTIYACCYAGE